MKKKELLFKAVTIIGSVLIAAVSSELIAVTILPDRHTYWIWYPNIRKVFYPEPNIMPGVFRAAHFTTNSHN